LHHSPGVCCDAIHNAPGYCLFYFIDVSGVNKQLHWSGTSCDYSATCCKSCQRVRHHPFGLPSCYNPWIRIKHVCAFLHPVQVAFTVCRGLYGYGVIGCLWRVCSGGPLAEAVISATAVTAWKRLNPALRETSDQHQHWFVCVKKLKQHHNQATCSLLLTPRHFRTSKSPRLSLARTVQMISMELY